MSYLIIDTKTNTAFFTEWYSFENMYVEGMIVITGGKISFDGKTFSEITEDHL